MSRLADLHIHTHFSDSTSSPEEVIEQANAQGLCCVAITDHDTVNGIAPTIAAARKYGIEVIPGVELSTSYNKKDVHMLGYFFDYTNPELLECLDNVQNGRVRRMENMIQKLKSLGVGHDIQLDDVTSLVESKSVGRPHLAQRMVEHGIVPNIQKAFDQYLAEGAPAFVAEFKQTPFDAIKNIHKWGGIVVLAHPNVTAVDELIPSMVEEGLDGIEIFYPTHSDKVIEFYQGIARKHKLLITGGSDAHGDAKKHTYVGKVKVGYELVEAMKARV